MAQQQTGVMIRFQAQSGRGDELAAHLSQTVRLAEREPGTSHWIVHRTPDGADTVWVYEVYADDEARAAHEASPAYHAARDVTRALLAGPPDVFPVIPVAGKGLHRTGA